MLSISYQVPSPGLVQSTGGVLGEFQLLIAFDAFANCFSFRHSGPTGALPAGISFKRAVVFIFSVPRLGLSQSYPLPYPDLSWSISGGKDCSASGS